MHPPAQPVTGRLAGQRELSAAMLTDDDPEFTALSRQILVTQRVKLAAAIDTGKVDGSRANGRTGSSGCSTSSGPPSAIRDAANSGQPNSSSV